MTTQLLAADLTPEAVLDFWFNDHGHPADTGLLMRRWFSSTRGLDHSIASKFQWAIDQALANGLKDWEIDPKGRLALIILLDQFTRTVFRGSVKAYMGDYRALRLAEVGWAHNEFEGMSWPMKVCALMPFEHSESLADQAFALAHFEKLSAQADAEDQSEIQTLVTSAQARYDVIQRFGRFPQRNQVLSRGNRDGEGEYLADQPRQEL